MSKKLRAFYSATMAGLTGTVIWARDNGTEVECTCVGKNPPLWDDTQDLGLVERYVRQGKQAAPDLRWHVFNP